MLGFKIGTTGTMIINMLMIVLDIYVCYYLFNAVKKYAIKEKSKKLFACMILFSLSLFMSMSGIVDLFKIKEYTISISVVEKETTK
ncbi:MAG: hypothetical protein RR744_00235 [Cellulosilyticaceae bacterium]